MLKHYRRNSLFLVLSIVVIAGAVSGSRFAAKPSRYVYVWAGTGNPATKGVNSLVVIDAEFELPKSGSYFLIDYGADWQLIEEAVPAHSILAGFDVS